MLSRINMEGIIDADYMQAKRVCQDVEIKHLDEYHVLYVQSDTLLLVDVFENFLNTSTEIYKLDFARLLLAYQSVLKKSKVKFDLLIDTDMLLINGRKKYQSRDMSRYSSICESL